MMGAWSRLVGEDFVDWLAPAAGLRWIDVGCGNGAFIELLVERWNYGDGCDNTELSFRDLCSRHRNSRNSKKIG
jgi:SAM-dependent methyltransferase